MINSNLILLQERKNEMQKLKYYLSILLVLSMMLCSTSMFTVNAQVTETEEIAVDTEVNLDVENELQPMMANACGFNSLTLLRSTSIYGYTVSMDLEYGGSGHNIHIIVNGQKYYYNFTNKCWPSGVPSRLTAHPEVIQALNHGLERIEAGWC